MRETIRAGLRAGLLGGMLAFAGLPFDSGCKQDFVRLLLMLPGLPLIHGAGAVGIPESPVVCVLSGAAGAAVIPMVFRASANVVSGYRTGMRAWRLGRGHHGR